MTTILRDYQTDMLSRLQKAWKRHRSVMVQMPTGTGKTHLMAETIRNASLELCPLATEGTQVIGLPLATEGTQESGVIVVAHRRELIEQISKTLEKFGIEHGVILSGKKIDYSKRVQVASIQTLSRRAAHGDCPLCASPSWNPGLVIIDEAHHALATTYRMMWEWWPKAKFLGLTATPCRLNNAPFTDLFQTLLQSWPIQEFIDKGWLSDFEYVSASPDSEALKRVRSLKKRGADGDYQTKELATVMDVPESIEHLYKTYRQFAGGKKGIVYAIDRRHAEHIAAYYNDMGVRCAVIDSKTPVKERERLVEEYKMTDVRCQMADGRCKPSDFSPQTSIDVLVNVDIFSEGFDAPEVEFIQLARPTLSLSKYLQQVGRGMRISPGKPHVLILDNVGLYQTFGLPTEERDWRQTFYGKASGKGSLTGERYVVLDESEPTNPLSGISMLYRELVNLEMVRIKKGGKKRAGLEIFLQDGQYGVMNNGKVSCKPRFKKIIRLNDKGGYFAAGIYAGRSLGYYVEYASLIDNKGIDQGLRLFRDVVWRDGIYYSSYKPQGYKAGDNFWYVYWDPKGNCYYDDNPNFKTVAGVEVAKAREHDDHRSFCYKLRYNTGKLSPRFDLSDMYFNKQIIIARDYLVVKSDKNHTYHICGYLGDTLIVQKEDLSGYQSISLTGQKGATYRSLPHDLKRISPISYLYYINELGLTSLHRPPTNKC